ncbi:MAG: ceramidase domain-containing protein, partial [Candidatus Competibacterales bacterium]
ENETEPGGWSTPIDAYCERVDPTFWAEPLNAVTNAAFLLAAFWVWRATTRSDRFDPGVGLLVALIGLIGMGSFLFHTVATRWAALTDVVPIALFIVTFFVLTLRRGFGLGWPWAVAGGIAYVPLSGALGAGLGALLGGLIGSSTGYLPALLALFVCGALLARAGHGGGLGVVVDFLHPYPLLFTFTHFWSPRVSAFLTA